MQYEHDEFRTEIAVAGELTVTGSLPSTTWRPEGSLAIRGDVAFLWRDQARELAAALQRAVDEMDDRAESRYGAITCSQPVWPASSENETGR